MTQFKTLTELTEFIDAEIEASRTADTKVYYEQFKALIEPTCKLETNIARISQSEDWTYTKRVIDVIDDLRERNATMLKLSSIEASIKDLGVKHHDVFYQFYAPMARFINAVNYYISADRTTPHTQRAIMDGLVAAYNEYRNVVTRTETPPITELLTQAALTVSVWRQLSKYANYKNISDARLGQIYMDVLHTHHEYVGNPKKLLADIDFDAMHISVSGLLTDNSESVIEALLSAETPAEHLLSLRTLISANASDDILTAIGAEIRSMVAHNIHDDSLQNKLTTLLQTVDLNTQSYWTIGRATLDMIESGDRPTHTPQDKVEHIQLFNKLYQLYTALMDNDSKQIGHTNRLELFGRTVAAYIEQFYMAGHR